VQSLERMIGILDLFGDPSFEWTFEELHERLGYTRSTLYRYLKVLSDAELITSLPGLGYALGPRIIELDYQIRTHDSLVRVSRPAMQELVSRETGVALLCRRYRQKVLCVHQESSANMLRSTYERGLARPLLRGSASVVILAHLPPHQINKLYEQVPAEFAAAGIGRSLEEVRATLKAHRQRGWMATTGAVTPGVTGIAAPIFDARQEIIGSLSLTVPERQVDSDKVGAIADQVVFLAGVITRSLVR
jgi:DNA-binding IclR family transcriptional regulator